MDTFANQDVTLEVNPVAARKLEHGIQLCLCDSAETVVDKVGHDLRVWAASFIHKLDSVVGVTEAEAALDFHAKLACESNIILNEMMRVENIFFICWRDLA